jgi:multiple sugar transport system ATP-binding protein
MEIIAHGKLVQVGSPREIYDDPSTSYVAQRLGQPRINLLPVGTLANGTLPRDAVTVGARTEHLSIAKSINGEGKVEWIEHLGDQNHLHVRVGSHHITTLAAPDTDLAAGDTVSLALVSPLYFDAAGNRVRER